MYIAKWNDHRSYMKDAIKTLIIACCIRDGAPCAGVLVAYFTYCGLLSLFNSISLSLLDFLKLLETIYGM